MVIGLMIITAIPTVTGVSQAISGQKKQEERALEEKRMKKFYIDIGCDADVAVVKRDINEHRIVLRDDLVWIGEKEALNPSREGYVAEAFYIEYPDPERKPAPVGLVSQTRAEPPLLNWIYVDKDTAELKYGNKTQSIEHHVGPWDWAENEEEITFRKRQMFIAVQHAKTKKWQIYYDLDKDGLSKYVPAATSKVYVTLQRTLLPGA